MTNTPEGTPSEARTPGRTAFDADLAEDLSKKLLRCECAAWQCHHHRAMVSEIRVAFNQIRAESFSQAAEIVKMNKRDWGKAVNELESLQSSPAKEETGEGA